MTDLQRKGLLMKNKEPFLRDYQMDAVKKMFVGCILNGGVGSGKSRTGLYYYFTKNGGSISDDGIITPMPNPKDLYIITTAQKRDKLEWEAELVYFLLSTRDEKPKITIDSWNNITKYTGIQDAFFMFDEDRVTGNGAWVKAFYKIAKTNDWIILSATPGDCWEDYIPVFLANKFYKNKTEFCREHCVYSRFTKWPQIERYINTGRLIRLRNKILINMDFNRSTVPHHYDIYADYDIKKYKEAIKTRWDPFKDEPIQQASGLCYVLRRIVNEDESRIVALMEILEKCDKAIIFYNFDYELRMLQHLFWNSDNEVETYDFDDLVRFDVAEWNGHAHQPIPKSDRWVYLVQYTAGCEGWNCILTDTIIFFSQNYSYKVVSQAAGRIDRLNTPYKDLYYYHLKSRSGIDIGIGKALKKKKKFNETRWVSHSQ